VVENLARDRAKQIFGGEHVNVQPHSGSQANASAYAAVLQAGDTILGLDLAHGGHLTHGHRLSFSGKLYRPTFYHVRRDTELIDYDELEAIAEREKPKVIIGGGSAYPRLWDFARMRQIADKVGAFTSSTWRTSPAWWRAACILRPCRTRTSPPPPRTRRCADRARADHLRQDLAKSGRWTRPSSPASRAVR
jgi:hypothetical protein